MTTGHIVKFSSLYSSPSLPVNPTQSNFKLSWYKKNLVAWMKSHRLLGPSSLISDFPLSLKVIAIPGNPPTYSQHIRVKKMLFSFESFNFCSLNILCVPSPQLKRYLMITKNFLWEIECWQWWFKWIKQQLLFFVLRSCIPAACKESSVRWPEASGFCFPASEFCC